MIKISFIFLIFTLNQIFSIEDDSNTDKIRFAFILTRTGSHAPSQLKKILQSSANKPTYKDIFGYEWKGPNELTTIGKRQQFLLGYRNYLEYNTTLFSEKYEPRELLAYSSECNKTIQSSYANLHGTYQKGIILTTMQMQNAIPPLLSSQDLYEEEKSELDKYGYSLPNNLQVVPVLTFYERDHKYLLEKTENCPNIQRFYKTSEKNAEFKKNEILNIYGDALLNILNDEKIFLDDSIKNYDLNYLKNNDEFFKIMAETYICNYIENFDQMDKFINKGIDKYKLLNLFEEYFAEISIGGGIKDEQRKQETFNLSKNLNYDLLTNLKDWMEKRIEYDMKNLDKMDYSAPKLVLYLSHHGSIESIYYLFKDLFFTSNSNNIKNPLYVNYSSFFGIELYLKNKDIEKESITKDDYYLKVIYDNKQIGDSISYNLFLNTIKGSIVSYDEVESFCGFNNTSKNNKENNGIVVYKYISTGLIILFAIVVIVFIIFYITTKNNNQNLGRLQDSDASDKFVI